MLVINEQESLGAVVHHMELLVLIFNTLVSYKVHEKTNYPKKSLIAYLAIIALKSQLVIQVH